MSDERLIRIEDKIDKIVERLGSMDVTLEKQHGQLEYHIKRTDLLEAELKPVRDHVRLIQAALKWLTIISVLAGLFKIFL